MIDKIKNRLKARIDHLEKIKTKDSRYQWSETYFQALLNEAQEVKDEIKENNSVYLEDELWDVFRNFVCLAYALENEWKITSIDKIFDRCYTKLNWRINEFWEERGDWDEMKQAQKKELKKEHNRLYWENDN